MYGLVADDLSPPATPPSSSTVLECTRPNQRSASSLDLLKADQAARFSDALNRARYDYLANIRASFQELDAEQQRHFITELLGCCDNQLLSFIHTLIVPKLKIDFFTHLPKELSLHILSFIHEPSTLAQAARVSHAWNALVYDEAKWRVLCEQNRFQWTSTDGSCRHFFQQRYSIETAWKQGPVSVTSCANDVGPGLVTSLQIDSQFIVVGCDNHRIEVFDNATGKHLRTLHGHEGGVWALQFVEHEGRHILVSGGCDRQARVWDLELGQSRHVLRGHSSTIRCLKVRDGSIAVTGSRDTTLRIWDIKHGRLLHLCLGHQASVRCLELHGNRVVSGSYDTTARVWDLSTGRCLQTLIGHHSQIYAIVFDGTRIATGSLDSTVRVWSADTGQCLATLHGHTSLVGHLQFLPNQTILVSGGSDGCLRIWDLDANECRHRISAHDNSVTCLHADERRLLSGGNDGRVKLWDMETGTLIRQFTRPGRTVWKVQLNDSKAVIVLQRRTQRDPEILQTAIELHDFAS